ncbi:MAG: DUF1934 family protein [Clostridia bacterium]|nr:DUF1934 family protein [Clostridia bacterium]
MQANTEILNCSVRIASFIDGKKTIFSGMGALHLSNGEVVALQYTQGDSLVSLSLKSGERFVRMTRKGDYFLDIPFSEKQTTIGKIGLSAGDAGEVTVYTERAEYNYDSSAETFNLSLSYALRFPKEEQKVILRLTTKRER